jgi:hypothetical protein
MQAKDLCLSLMRADTEEEIIRLLKNAGYWDDDRAWRFFGDRDTNYNQIGNQQSRSDAALVEKLVNSVDARLLNECLVQGINPESSSAPQNIRQAIARFFEENPSSPTAGLIKEWTNSKRTEIAKSITLAATGAKPGEGNPCFTISDSGEGQTPGMLPYTLLSLDKSNKFRIPFVQGKFNMGGTGVLEFCGQHNLQLIVSRRNPDIVSEDHEHSSDLQWSFTVVRREDPKGMQRSSVYTYLAPLESEDDTEKKGVLSFSSETMPIFPNGRDAYAREARYGTLTKLYEYSATGFKTNILLKDGLMRRVDLLLPDIALPMRFHECRSYSGHEGSYETTLIGLKVRLEDNKAENLEHNPTSFSMKVHGEEMTGTIYAFKKGKADTYRKNEGIIFALNGQTHGYLTPDFFGRKKVGLGYLRDSILIIVDCAEFSGRAREKLFMNSRDRLRAGELRAAIEDRLEDELKQNHSLRELKERRRREEIESRLEDSKPLEEVLRPLLEKSPVLSELFLHGRRASTPFRTKSVGTEDKPFEGKRYPSIFKFKGKVYGAELHRDCHINQRCRIAFETDAVSDYFSREIDRGEFSLFVESNGRRSPVEDYAVNLQNGIATLSVQLPANCCVGDEIRCVSQATDSTRIEPFENRFAIRVKEAIDQPRRDKKPRSKPPSKSEGNEREIPSGIELPEVRKVYENPEQGAKGWEDMSPPFDKYSAMHVVHAGRSGDNGDDRDIYDFFVNADNIYLKSEMKPKDQDSEVVSARFIYGMVLLGLALLQEEKKSEEQTSGDIMNGHVGEDDTPSIEDKVESFSKAVAPVLLPMIDYLGALDLEVNTTVGTSGEST